MKMPDFLSKMNKRTIFCLPCIILALALICGVIYGFILKNPLNVGMDFTGGYYIEVQMGTALSDEQFRREKEELATQIIEQPETVTASAGVSYSGLKVKSISLHGTPASYKIYIKFVAPDYSYQQMVGDGSETDKGIIGEISDAIEAELFTSDYYSGLVSGDSVGGTISAELLIAAICGIIAALGIMVIYTTIRFDLAAGAISMLGLLNDMLMMFAFMTIFHIEFAGSFIAALIAVLVFSYFGSITLFDKIKEKIKSAETGTKADSIAKESTDESFKRTVIINGMLFGFALLIMGFSAILGAFGMITFCLPLLAGVLASTFSSALLCPSVWSAWKTKQGRTVGTKVLAPTKKSAAAILPVKDAGFEEGELLDTEGGEEEEGEQPDSDDEQDKKSVQSTKGEVEYITVSESSTANESDEK